MNTGRWNGRASEKAGARDGDDDRRFHLSYEYTNPEKGWKNNGNQVVQASSLEEAAKRIARNIDLKGLKEITITKRHFYGKPANEFESINRTFKI